MTCLKNLNVSVAFLRDNVTVTDYDTLRFIGARRSAGPRSVKPAGADCEDPADDVAKLTGTNAAGAAMATVLGAGEQHYSERAFFLG